MTKSPMPLRSGRARDQRRADRAVLLPLRRLSGGAWRRLCAGIRLSGRRGQGRPRRSDDVETEAQSPLHLPRMRHAPVHRCPGGGACGASMGSCSRRANSSPRFTCSASSRSGRSSTTFRITRACRSGSAARTKWLGGSARSGRDSRFEAGHATDAGASASESAPAQNLYPIRAPTCVRPGLMWVQRLACEMCSILAMTSQCSSNW